MFMVEPAGRKPDPQRRSPPPHAAPADVPWPAHSPLDPAVRRFRRRHALRALRGHRRRRRHDHLGRRRTPAGMRAAA
ncbi:hypothetical protein EIJ76_16990 [Xanthomonas perforans]|nr:hypothetical protein EIJ76_16990 [Xanthomonas perforans]